MGYADYTIFEWFVKITVPIWWFVDTHPGFGVVSSALIILTNWLIFKYHLDYLTDLKYAVSHVQIVGRFSRPTYEMWKWVGLTIPPLGFVIILFTGFTMMRTTPFLAVFGIKGTGRIKAKIMKQAFKHNTILSAARRKDKGRRTFYLPKILQ